MSITTIYKCDKCGKEQDTNQQFWTVGVSASCSPNPPPSTSSPRYFVENMSMQVCRLCLEKFGIYAKKVEEPEQQPRTPTLEELIIEIVINAMQE
jgi:hypothetical protein